MPRQPYPYDVTDAEWTLREPPAPAPLPGGRPPRHARREIVNAILYVRRTGCQWRALPHDLPPWGTVWWYFRQWREAGVWETVNTALRERVRVRLGREPTPSAAGSRRPGRGSWTANRSRPRQRGAARLRSGQKSHRPQAPHLR